MVVADDVDIKEDVPRLHEASQGFALDMVVGRGVRLRAVLVVLKDRLACVSPTAVVVVVSMQHVPRGLREVQCFARHMVVENAAYLQGVRKVLKEAHHCAKAMVGENVASSMVVGFVPRVYMEAPIFVLPMVVERGVWCQGAQRVHAVVLIVVLGMVVGSGASLKIVGKVPKEAQTSAKLMVEESDVLGQEENVKNLQGARVVFVQHIVAWFRSGRIRREV